MSLPQDTGVRLEAFLELLQRFAGFEIQADVRQVTSVPISEVPSVEILVEFSGRDEALLVANQGELLIAMESLAADFLALEGAARQRIRFDSGQFRADRERALAEIAKAAADDVRTSHVPHIFAAMSESDRRLLRRSLAELGLVSESVGVEPTRYVVLYPDGIPAPGHEACGESQVSR